MNHFEHMCNKCWVILLSWSLTKLRLIPKSMQCSPLEWIFQPGTWPLQHWQPPHDNMPLAKDLLHPSPEAKRKHKKEHLVQSPNSYFLGMTCSYITTICGHSQIVLLCAGCSTSSVSNRRQSQACRRMRLQKEVALKAPWIKMSEEPSQ